jgi:hypothetical protein
MTATVSLSFAALNIDCADPAALADFWGKALGRPVSPGAVAGDTAVDVTGPQSGPRMIQPVAQSCAAGRAKGSWNVDMGARLRPWAVLSRGCRGRAFDS